MNEIDRFHRRYDGPIPADARAALRAGGWARLASLRTEARRRVFDSLALDAVRAICGRRREMAGADKTKRDGPRNDRGLFALIRDLRFYRDQGTGI